jgi:hypothetical protein
MYESKSFAYLDLQKTGTNFIVDFLDRFNGESGAERRKHKPLVGDAGRDRLFFISVRNPLDQYISLFSFGCDGKGSLFKKLSTRGRGNLYGRGEGAFERWLEFMLVPEYAALVDKKYANVGDGHLPSIIGFQSFRFLYLALQDPLVDLSECRTRDDVVQIYRTHSRVSVIVRHSHFISDLKDLVRLHLRDAISDTEAALKFLDEAPALNKSRRIDDGLELRLSAPLYRSLREREWLYYDGVVDT